MISRRLCGPTRWAFHTPWVADRHFAVDSIVSETDAIHAGAPELASARATPQAAITTPEAGPEGAMTDKVMKLLQDMMLKKQAAQAKKESSPQASHMPMRH